MATYYVMSMADTALANGCCCLHFLMKACSKGSPPIYIASLLPYATLHYIASHCITLATLYYIKLHYF